MFHWICFQCLAKNPTSCFYSNSWYQIGTHFYYQDLVSLTLKVFSVGNLIQNLISLILIEFHMMTDFFPTNSFQIQKKTKMILVLVSLHFVWVQTVFWYLQATIFPEIKVIICQGVLNGHVYFSKVQKLVYIKEHF